MVVEGTYPYVRGGVSGWIHNLIRALPTKTFCILFIGATPDTPYELRYELPENVIGVHHLYAQDFREEKLKSPEPTRATRAEKKKAWELMKRYHQGIARDHGVTLFDEVYEASGNPHTRSLSLEDLFSSKAAWDLIVELYREGADDSSFVDYFWTFRFSHLPILQMMQAELPPARVYHTATTGFAGFLAAIAKKRLGVPMIVTEHGLYTRERGIEIAQAAWIHVEEAQDYKIRRTQGFFKQWWIEMFRMMSRLCYEQADRVITITQANQGYQLTEGADPEKMSVIPNGIRPERFAEIRDVPRPTDEFVVGFIGRVVPIKDVKTLVRAVKIATADVPNLKVYVIGPYDEDPEYFDECRRLTELLDLKENIEYTGPQNVAEYYAKMHACVLTSVSEGQPLVILEANSAGVPVIATNVGACSELLYGRLPEDRALGAGGIITAVASPQETAEAFVIMAKDEELRQGMIQAGIQRMERFYSEEYLNRTYLRLYDTLAEQGAQGNGR